MLHFKRTYEVMFQLKKISTSITNVILKRIIFASGGIIVHVSSEVKFVYRKTKYRKSQMEKRISENPSGSLIDIVGHMNLVSVICSVSLPVPRTRAIQLLTQIAQNVWDNIDYLLFNCSPTLTHTKKCLPCRTFG